MSSGFEVFLSEAASRDILDYARYLLVTSGSTRVSRKWLDSIRSQISEIAPFPRQFPLIPDVSLPSRELRAIHFHSHRIIYEVDELKKSVTVVRVLHAARHPLSPTDVDLP